jgi:mono/diheme cytochrome c family protein
MKKLIPALLISAAFAAMSRAEDTNAPAAAAHAKTPPPGMEDFKISGDPAKGAEIFKLYCVACHGDSGKGDGVTAAALNPKPRDFTDKARMATIPDWEVFKVIKDGGASVGLSPMMTPWGPLLKDDQKIHDLSAYVRTFAK